MYEKAREIAICELKDKERARLNRLDLKKMAKVGIRVVEEEEDCDVEEGADPESCTDSEEEIEGRKDSDDETPESKKSAEDIKKRRVERKATKKEAHLWNKWNDYCAKEGIVKLDRSTWLEETAEETEDDGDEPTPRKKKQLSKKAATKRKCGVRVRKAQ